MSPATAVPARGLGGDLASRAMSVLLPFVWRCRVEGAQHVPATGPVLLAANHSGLLDGPLVWTLAPRDVRFLVKEEMFTGLLGVLLRATRQVAIDRAAGRRALEAASAVLAAGGAVGVFPEGSRGRGDAARLRSGVAWLALRTGAPVVPVAVLGTRAARGSTSGLPRPRTRLHVSFAQPLVVRAAPGAPGRVALAEATEQVRTALSDHVRAAVARTGAVLPDLPPAAGGRS